MKSPLKKELKVLDIAGRYGYEVLPRLFTGHRPASVSAVCPGGVCVGMPCAGTQARSWDRAVQLADGGKEVCCCYGLMLADGGSSSISFYGDRS